jgi:hypothetical protein
MLMTPRLALRQRHNLRGFHMPVRLLFDLYRLEDGQYLACVSSSTYKDLEDDGARSGLSAYVVLFVRKVGFGHGRSLG